MCNWYPSTWWWSKKRGLMFSWCIPVEVFNSWKKYFCFFKRTPRPKIWNFGGSLNWRLSTPATLNPSVPPLLWSQPRVFSIVLDPVQSQHGFSPVIPELSLFGGTLQKQYLTVQFYCPKKGWRIVWKWSEALRFSQGLRNWMELGSNNK